VKRRVFSRAVLVLVLSLCGLGILIDAVVLLENPSSPIQLILAADVPIFFGAIANLFLGPEAPAERIESGTIDSGIIEPSMNPSDSILQGKLDSWRSPDVIGDTSRSTDPATGRTKMVGTTKPSEKSKNYLLSPEKLKVPAFVCRCGHPHRFVCLDCGMNLENAAHRKGMHWVEWVSELEAFP